MRFKEGEPMPAIISVGMATGRRVVTNEDLDKFLNRRPGLTATLMNKVGIRQRFWVENGQATSDLCVVALQEAMRTAGIGPPDIKSLFIATSSPDMWGVSTAAIVQEKSGLQNGILASNNSDACPGFIFALQRAFTGFTSPLGLNGNSYCGVIGAEVISQVLGRDDKFSHKKRRRETISILVGDGAGAVIIKMVTPDKGVPTNMGFAFGVDGKYADELGVEAGGSRLPTSLETILQGRHYLHMNGEVIFDQAILRMSEATKRALDEAGVPIEAIDFFVPHQANRKIIKGVADSLGVPMEKVIITIGEYGNTSASSIPIALWEAIEKGEIHRNHMIATSSFGAGLTYAAAVFPMVGLPR